MSFVSSILGVAVGSIFTYWISMKKISKEIENSRIEWIQKVREVEDELINAIYKFKTDADFYIKVKRRVDSLQNIIENIEVEVIKPNSKNEHIAALNDNLNSVKASFAKEEDRLNQLNNSFGEVKAAILKMKNLFPTKHIDIKGHWYKRLLFYINGNKSSLNDRLSVLEKHEITNEAVVEDLEGLKSNLLENYNKVINNTQDVRISEENIEKHAQLISDYLKVEWERVKVNKGMY
ncbi:hypothetical protein QS426_08325 [Staphylococcus pseudintermedius]|uniref:hypothetical protein n=1 Tax=Staphylococcus pseudintermedius TaxID=283734 RepID=UPI001931E3DF|nr:hypothetical protein [Staphylococcus pseudintermedius]EGQ3794389.1 hypothetical protein [Staphylococcus pseudintermedius]EHT8042712.1 hypothetical protein [Staphylococcus pseudintermedius]EHT8099335.1 hypothetical protein [Staphylococcus pseudintermedius]ELP8688191.1 hypothetical protein [Staphylococcus pseudintermedius]MBM0287770.1 hypothetical protein [Staphylococcus pseudintermedius]